MEWLIQNGRRVARITAGIVVLVVGLILSIPGVPGPGFVLIFLGLSILAVDFVWAHRLKTRIKDEAGKVVNKVRGKPAAKQAEQPTS